jgi:DNA-binding response OmpR family regulator
VEFASTGEAAVERVARGGVDLLILDLVLTGMSGQEVLERLRQDAPRPRVVVVTGRNDYPSFARAMRRGADAYLVKPFRLNVLLGACEGVFGNRDDSAVPERRAERRHAMAGTVRISDRRGAALASGTLVDLSPGGAQVQLASPLEVRSLVRVAADASSGLMVDVEGCVAWRGAGPRELAHGVGFAHAS